MPAGVDQDEDESAFDNGVVSSPNAAQAIAAGAIFREAIERPEGERSRLLDMRCAGDPGLRRQVEAMLETDANEFPPLVLDPDGVAALRGAAMQVLGRLALSDEAQPVRLEPGVMVGRYRIVRRIAEGGSSVVFEAVQEPTRLRVALKVHRLGIGSGPARRRFLDESRILARLHHPAIAQVYDAGIGRAGGRDDDEGCDLPWIAVELVPGAAPILAACDARGLDRHARLRLFETVCDAVQHAHQRGVIHRDLKPANILVGDDGQPKVIDFGIGRLTQATSLHTVATDHGALLGTIGYMSPEQCAGTSDAVDVRCDVYSLGVTLFELICGQPPRDLANQAPMKAMLSVATSSVRRPSLVDPTVRGDLEQILLHALEREPADRYQSAGALGADIGRLLNNEPIDARPPSWPRRLSLFARRNRIAAALLALAVALLIGGVAAITTVAILFNQKLDRIRMIDKVLSDVAVSVEDSHIPVGVLRAKLDRVSELIADGGDPPAREAEWRSHLAAGYKNLGIWAKAEVQFRRLAALRCRLDGGDVTNSAGPLQEVAECLFYDWRFAEAEAMAREVLEIYRIHGDREGRASDVAGILAESLAGQGRLDEAIPRLRARVETAERGAGGGVIGIAMSNLATALRDGGELDAAETLFEQSLRKIDESGDGQQRPFPLRNYALLLAATGDLDQARRLLEEALELRSKRLNPGNPWIASTLVALADVLMRAGDSIAAEKRLNDALSILDDTQGRNHPETACARSQLAAVLLSLGSPEGAMEAERLAGEAMEILAATARPPHRAAWNRFDAMSTVGAALVAQARDPSLSAAEREQKLRAAEPLLIEGFNGMDPPPAWRYRKDLAGERIGELHELWPESKGA